MRLKYIIRTAFACTACSLVLAAFSACGAMDDDVSSQQSFDTTPPTTSATDDNELDDILPGDDDDDTSPGDDDDLLPDVSDFDDILPGDDDNNDNNTSPGNDGTTSDPVGTSDLPSEDLEAMAPVEGALVSNDLTMAEIEALDNTKQGFGSGVIFDADGRPVGSTSMQSKYNSYDAYYIGENINQIYLTFDEGYEKGFTPAILDTLLEKQVQAVFFITYDYAKGNPELVQRMIDEGHVVGNHSTKHPSMPTRTVEEGMNEIATLHNYIYENFGYKMWLFRPPMGEFSVRTLAYTQNIGYKSVFWSFAYVDWDVDNQPNKSIAFDKITSRTHNGAIILLHAVSQTNTEILGDLIDHWRASGYELNPFV